MRCAVDHRGVDDLPDAAGARLVHRRQQPGHQVERAGEVADQVERHRRRPVGRPERAQGTGGGDVRDVVPGLRGVRPVLAPAGHPAVDEARRSRMALRRADAEAFGDAGPEALDEQVGARREVEAAGDVRGRLEVQRDRALAAPEQVLLGRHGGEHLAARTVDAHDVSTEVGEQHRGERARTDARQLEDPDTVERPGHREPPVTGAAWAARRGRRPRSTRPGCARRCAGRPGRSRGRRTAGCARGARRGRC